MKKHIKMKTKFIVLSKLLLKTRFLIKNSVDNVKIFSLINYNLFLVFCFLLAGCNYTSVRQASNYKEVLSGYTTMVLLPIEVEMKLIDTSNKLKRLHAYEHHLEELVKNNIIYAMKLKGIELSFLSRKETYNKGIHNEVLRLRKKFNEKMSLINHDKLEIENNAYLVDINFGIDPIQIGIATNADTIMLADFSGFSRTAGAMIQDFLWHTRKPIAGSKMSISIIDVKSGKLLWNNYDFTQDEYFTFSSENKATRDKIDNKIIKTYLNNILKDFCYRCDK